MNIVYREFPIVLCELFLIVFVINFRFLFLHSPERQSKTDYRYRVQIFPDLQDRRPRYWLAQREGMNEEGSWYSDVGLRRDEFSNPIMSMFWTAQSEDYQIFSVWQKSLNLLKVSPVNKVADHTHTNHIIPSKPLSPLSNFRDLTVYLLLEKPFNYGDQRYIQWR